MVRYFTAREIGTALSLTRHMKWQESILLYDELPEYTTVLLSENDFIVDSVRVRKWLGSFPESNEYTGNV